MDISSIDYIMDEPIDMRVEYRIGNYNGSLICPVRFLYPKAREIEVMGYITGVVGYSHDLEVISITEYERKRGVHVAVKYEYHGAPNILLYESFVRAGGRRSFEALGKIRAKYSGSLDGVVISEVVPV